MAHTVRQDPPAQVMAFGVGLGSGSGSVLGSTVGMIMSSVTKEEREFNILYNVWTYRILINIIRAVFFPILHYIIFPILYVTKPA